MGPHASDVTFLSLVGLEGSGHHGITPLLLHLLNDSFSIADAHHEWQTGAVGQVMPWSAFMEGNLGGSLMTAITRADMGALCGNLTRAAALHNVRLKPPLLLYTAYSFPDGTVRSLSAPHYNLTRLHTMLEGCGVRRRAIIKYERSLDESTRSFLRRFSTSQVDPTVVAACGGRSMPLLRYTAERNATLARCEQEHFEQLL